jgi:hypothetical protein
MEQFKNTEAQAKGAATAARKSVASIEESAKAAFTTGANEVSKVAEKLVDGLSDEAKSTVADVKAGAERTAAGGEVHRDHRPQDRQDRDRQGEGHQHQRSQDRCCGHRGCQGRRSQGRRLI